MDINQIKTMEVVFQVQQYSIIQRNHWGQHLIQILAQVIHQIFMVLEKIVQVL